MMDGSCVQDFGFDAHMSALCRIAWCRVETLGMATARDMQMMAVQEECGFKGSKGAQ